VMRDACGLESRAAGKSVQQLAISIQWVGRWANKKGARNDRALLAAEFCWIVYYGAAGVAVRAASDWMSPEPVASAPQHSLVTAPVGP
jgi:hypothetical protein